MTASLPARIAVAVAASAGFGIAGAWSVRLAWADYWFRQETTEATQRAIEIAPGQSAYRVRLALLAGDADPALALAALRQAVALNPHDGRAWIELGYRLETMGDFAAAERTLLRAANEDRTYLPRWTLMNYYFRLNNTGRFWFWAKAAAPLIYGDPQPLFHLCGRVAEDGLLVDRLNLRSPRIQAGYLFYLLDVGRADLAGPASRRLMAENREADVPLLLEACDRLIGARQVDDALALWDGLARSRRLPFAVRRNDAESLLTNGGFGVSPTGHGLDWHLPAIEGISAAREENPSGLRLTFSGMQDEQAEPLFQFVPVRENTAYELTFAYRTAGIPPRSGISWQIEDLAGGLLLADAQDYSSEEDVQRRLMFITPRGCRMIRLSLVYRRRPGTTRIAGYFVLRDVALRLSRQSSVVPPPWPSVAPMGGV